MAKLYFGVQSAALTFEAEREFSDGDVAKIMAAMSADPDFGIVKGYNRVEQFTTQPVLDAEGVPTGETTQVSAGFMNVPYERTATPQEVAQAIGDDTLAKLLDKANAHALQASIDAVKASFTPIQPTT